MNELALFAGAGGGILGGKILGWNTVGAVEIEPAAREMLLARQRDGILPRFPIWDDVTTFDGKPWRGLVDIVTGGFPCQDISCAGKGAGINGKRSGLWSEMCRIISEVRPRFAFMENSPMLTIRGLDRVLADLAEIGYNAQWQTLSAAEVGAPHRRERIWILAKDSFPNPMCERERRQPCSEKMENPSSDTNLPRTGWGNAQPRTLAPFVPNTDLHACAEQEREHERPEEPCRSCTNELEAGRNMVDTDSLGRIMHEVFSTSERQSLEQTPARKLDGTISNPRPGERAALGDWWKVEPDVGRVADGVAHRMDRLKAIGNGQVPLVAATAFCILNHSINTFHTP